MGDSQFDYPVSLAGHAAKDVPDYGGRDKFECPESGAYMHTGAWPTWSYCPFCGTEVN